MFKLALVSCVLDTVADKENGYIGSSEYSLSVVQSPLLTFQMYGLRCCCWCL